MKVETSVFSGPLDLMLSLIEKREIDICEVSISEIADDYLEHVASMEWLDIDQAAEFLVIAATLLYIKVKALLPEEELAEGLGIDEDELPDPGAELVLRLIEYRRYRDAARVMRSLESHGYQDVHAPAASASKAGQDEGKRPGRSVSQGTPRPLP